MKKLFVSVLAAISLWLVIPGTGWAQYTGPPNVVGLFEFQDGTGATGTFDVGTPVTIYLVLIQPVDEQNGDTPYSAINAFELMLNFNPPGNLFLLGAILPPGAGDNFDPTDISAGFLEYIVGLASDFPVTDETVVLITFTFMVSAPGNIEVTLGPTFDPSIPGEMAFQSVAGELRVMYSTSGSHDAPVFWFGHGPNPVKNETFGSVKALYR